MNQPLLFLAGQALTGLLAREGHTGFISEERQALIVETAHALATNLLARITKPTPYDEPVPEMRGPDTGLQTGL